MHSPSIRIDFLPVFHHQTCILHNITSNFWNNERYAKIYDKKFRLFFFPLLRFCCRPSFLPFFFIVSFLRCLVCIYIFQMTERTRFYTRNDGNKTPIVSRSSCKRRENERRLLNRCALLFVLVSFICFSNIDFHNFSDESVVFSVLAQMDTAMKWRWKQQQQQCIIGILTHSKIYSRKRALTSTTYGGRDVRPFFPKPTSIYVSCLNLILREKKKRSISHIWMQVLSAQIDPLSFNGRKNVGSRDVIGNLMYAMKLACSLWPLSVHCSVMIWWTNRG